MTLDRIPEDGSDESPNWRRRVAVKVNQMILGGGDNVSAVDLSTGTAATVISDTRIGVTSKVVLVPENAAAAALAYDGVTFVTATKAGQATITHTAQTSVVTMGYVVTGS